MFETLGQLPPDPILGIAVAYRQDPNPHKVDLGVGVYKDESGQTPILRSVRAAEQRLFEQESSKSYAPAAGDQDFIQAIEHLIFGADHPALKAGRISTAQTPGGCGALRVAAELIVRANPRAQLWVSDPTWTNHPSLLGNSGLQIREYPYYDYARHEVRFDEMFACLQQAGAGDLVLLHACCHNPAGADLTPEQWRSLTELAEQRGFTPFIDMAYQGFAEGLEQDAYGLRLMAERLPELVAVNSCSKNFALYRERTGSVSLISADPARAGVVGSQLASVIRGIYSTPPTHGAGIVSAILLDPQLRAGWLEELDAMRTRIQSLRQLFTDSLARAGADRDFSFITRQRGMFSFLGISAEQAQRLRRESGIYMLDSSRINIAGINSNNLTYLSQAIAAIL